MVQLELITMDFVCKSSNKLLDRNIILGCVRVYQNSEYHNLRPTVRVCLMLGVSHDIRTINNNVSLCECLCRATHANLFIR